MATPKLPSATSLPWSIPTRPSYVASKPSLTAAATLLSPARPGRPTKKTMVRDGAAEWYRMRDIGWQTEVVAAMGQVPELRFAVNSIARAAGQALVVPDTSATSDGPMPPATSATSPSRPDDAMPVAVTQRMTQLLSAIGECYLISWRNNPEPKAIDVLSPLEIRWDRASGIAFLPRSWGTYDPINLSMNKVRLTRVHVPDMAVWDRADSAPRTALPVLRELIGLTMAVSACIDSRLVTAGMIIYPSSAGAAAPPDGTGTIHEADMPLGEALLEAGTAAIANQGAAEARMPILVEIPDEWSGKGAVEFIDFATKMDAQTTEMRNECVRRLAIGLDVPPEILLGLQNTTSHFATWAVQDDFVRFFIEPMLEMITEALWVHTEQKWAFDLSPLQRRPNLSVEAIQLYDRGAISAQALRYATGFTDADAPANKDSDFDTAAWEKLESMLQKSPSLAQTPGLPAVFAQIKAVMKGESPENAIYPGHSVVVSEDETPRAEGAPIQDKDDPRSAPPAKAPATATPRADGSPTGGSKGRPAPLPSTGT